MAPPSSNHPQTSDLQLPETDHLSPTYSLATRTIHADDPINSTTDVAPALHVSTTFRFPRETSQLIPTSADDEEYIPTRDPGSAKTLDAHVYSREAAPNTSRLEVLLTSLLGAPALTYSSGLAAFHALLVYLHPRVVAIGGGYHGCHGVLKVYQKLTNCKIVDLYALSADGKDDAVPAEAAWDAAGLGKGDVIHMETPINPTGRAYNIAALAAAAHKRGAWLTVDATFAPPPLQDPFAMGADFVMHSGTKYFGGHSDMLCGVLAVGTKGREKAEWTKDYWGMYGERVFLGGVMGSLEGWLGIRSLRTLELRVKRQSENAGLLVKFFDACLKGEKVEGVDDEGVKAVRKGLEKVEHASLQHNDMSWLLKQMPNGFGPVFALWMKDEGLAKALPGKLQLFHHATSLGGVESLIEWRRMSDTTVDVRLCRVSVGVEDWRDLRDDFVAGFKALA